MTLLSPTRNYIDFNRVRRPSDRLDRTRVQPQSAISALEELNLLGGLQICLDAGDRHSYTSGDIWFDRSRNRYDFYRGADGTTDGTEPTFNGSAGGLSGAEYFGFDGGDYFTLASSNPTWVNALHKDNARFGYIGWWYNAGGSGDRGLWGTRGANAGGNIGFAFFFATGTNLVLAQRNGSANQAIINTFSIGGAGWYCLYAYIDEAGGAGASFYGANNSITTFDGAYSSPSGSDASFTLQLASFGNASQVAESGTRSAMHVFRDTLTPVEAMAFFRATRGRFGV